MTNIFLFASFAQKRKEKRAATFRGHRPFRIYVVSEVSI
jgi:hypothetical protein